MQPSDFQPFADWFSARHLRKRGVAASAHTLRTKKVYLSIAAQAAGVDNPRVLGELLGDRDQIENLLDKMSVSHAPASMRQCLYALKPFGEYARLQGWTKACLLQPTDWPAEGPQKPIVVYTPEEMEQFVTYARGHSLRWWAFLAFLADTGRRVGEALKLEWAWFRPNMEPPYFELPTTKNGQPQYVPLGRRLMEEVFTPSNVAKLQAEIKGKYKVFKRSPAEHPFPWEYSTAHGIFRRFCETTGLPNRGFHNFRHTVITTRIAKGVPIQAVASLAGHKSAKVTMERYNHAVALDYARFLDT